MSKTLPNHAGGPNFLGNRINNHWEQNPGEPLLILKPGLSVSASVEDAMMNLLERASRDFTGPVVLTALTNTDANTDFGVNNELNPFSGLTTMTGQPLEPLEPEALVALLAPGELTEWQAWPSHMALLSAEAVERLAKPDTSLENALRRLREAGGTVLLADSIFLHDATADLFFTQPLEPHEHRRAKPWGLLRYRLDNWLRNVQETPAIKQALENFQRGKKPVTLHITHSWGGGVAKWVESFVDADEDGINLQLCSEEPESGKGYGQRFSLFLGNQLKTPVATWWLQPAIQSTAESHAGYQRMLQQISARYGVGRVMISSLVGHSLHSLSTGLPTIQVLHDFFPLWPLLGIHPAPFLSNDPEQRLETALQEHRLLPGFRNRTADSWKALGREWRETIVKWNVHIAAPSNSVAILFRKLDPGWANLDIAIIPHGLPSLPGSSRITPRDRDDGRLRLVIPGRIQHGKGQQLLRQALPQLREIAQVYLLGAGKEGEAFFGQSGVNVILQYQREEFRELLADIGPHLAGLLSIVPETFSYTLSEMHQLDIPVIATRVGSFEERIMDGETGWLIEPEPAALIEQLRVLAENRPQIDAMRERLSQIDLPGTSQMVAQYQALCAPATAPRILNTTQDLAGAQLAALAFQNTELTTSNRVLDDQARTLQTEVEKRTAWAEDREREVQRRTMRVADLKGQLQHEQADHRQTNLNLENLTSLHDWVVGTKSWRFTKPFRVLGRILHNLKRARAWNPLRWPLLFSQSVRTIITLGVGGALEKSQSIRTQPGIPEHPEPATLEAIGNPQPPDGFAVTGNPKVSIIIPVYNKWPFTAACLRSLADTQCQASFEVIVVDDQSSDETPGYLGNILGLTHLRNENNLGFVGSCNRGAKSARGRYIVMLNNDTQVTNGWLDALIETFRFHPDTGIAGAKLVYPDGSLQEAGGIIFRDGSGWNYGKGDDSLRPEYQYIREVDYCSGACIMLETRLFAELGGFDTYYAPAYYEDTDLAFRVREKGLKVRVQPASLVVHHEGITSGTDISDGAKRYQAVNHGKFFERWQQKLASHPEPIADPDNNHEIRQARDHRQKGRVLIIDAYTPEPDQDSGSVRLCYLMDCLAQLGYGVTFLSDNRGHAGTYTKALQQAGVEVIYDPWIGSLRGFFSERGDEFDFVMISRHYVATNYQSILKRYCPRAKFIFDTVDLHYLREERQALHEDSLPLRRSAAQTRRSELAVINAADVTIVVSPVEKAVLAESAPDARVHVISNIHEVTGSQRPYQQRKDLFFVGGYQHPPNIDAAKWFVGSIWPLVRKELPELQFHLIGSKAPEQVRALDGNGVRFHGFVESLDPWLDGCRLAVAPLRYGAGIKGKVNMSMSRGQPVVATPMGVEGMFVKSGREVLVAETAEDFAASIVRLYQDEKLWNQLSAAGLENVRQYFSVETARLGLQELLKDA